MNENITKFVIVPYERMDELLQKVDKLSEALMNAKQDKGALGEFITEKEAKELLSKGTTWFWNKRQSGELVGRKAGNQWYYKKSEILKFIENGAKSFI